MAKNLVREEFLNDSTWTCPAGVTRVRVYTNIFLFNQISGSQISTYAIRSDRTGYAWGGNNLGALGDGTSNNSSSPVLILGALSWQQISGNGQSGLGISGAGDAYGWGLNDSGQLGIGSVTPRSSPVLVLGGFKWRQIATSTFTTNGFSCAINSAGAAYAWGNNIRGQLGLGDVIPRSSPVIVLGGKLWRQVVQGSDYCLGIDNAGDAYAWGFNDSGQLGLGDVTPRSSPVLVLGGLKWTSLSAGYKSAYGITTTKDMYAWGINGNGQLGLGNVIPRSSPVIVLGGLKWRSMAPAAGSIGGAAGFVLALQYGTGAAYAWGFNTGGMLGVGDNIPRSSPVAVVGGFNFMQVACGTNQSFGIDSNANAYAWGSAGSGQLGVGDLTPRSSPVLVVGSNLWQTVYNAEVNSRVIDVVPGTSYNVRAFGATASFAYIGQYENQNASGSNPVMITLEYEA